MIQLLVRADRLALASGFQSKDLTRYMLNGVSIEPSKQGGVVLAATDGHRLGAFRDTEGHATAKCILQLPAAARRAIMPMRDAEEMWFGIVGETLAPGRRLGILVKPPLFERVTKKDEPMLKTATARATDAMQDQLNEHVLWSGAVYIIDGDFPEWRRTLPKDVAQSAGKRSLNPKLLAPFTAVAPPGTPLMLFGSSPDLPMMIDAGRDDFFGLLMPMRNDESKSVVWRDGKFGAPSWACAVGV